MTEPIQEYADSRGVTLRVDRPSGVLRGVKLIGLESQNRRRYRAEALAAAVGLYEGAKVNVNHPQQGPLSPRDYRDRLGVIRQVVFRPGEGLFGNLHFNPKHALAEQLVWDAENNPSNVGFSHNVLARLSRDGEQTVVEAITHVQSVDLVADPAATHGLFEQEEQEEQGRGTGESAASAPESPSADFAALTLEALLMHRPDLLETHAASATAALREELQSIRAQEAQSRSRPRSREQQAALGVAARGAGTAREFAQALRS
ncbi:MAG TPA: hypothetical protein VEQ85_13115 [Lacipirellulaceae bacterium]|nr:hypothetical protein [Lacipirellulaceae bacterium]